ncbi:MAG: hypothetical protein ACJ75R_04815 [Solirubrobacterales bacterium]
MPTIPGLPFVGDPLRRIRVPADLDSVTTVGDEADPADAGVDPENGEAIWKAAIGLYRSRVHPAVQVCVIGWADPERGKACAVITNGKPTLYPELPRFFGLTRRITSEMPKVDPATIAF